MMKAVAELHPDRYPAIATSLEPYRSAGFGAEVGQCLSPDATLDRPYLPSLQVKIARTTVRATKAPVKPINHCVRRLIRSELFQRRKLWAASATSPFVMTGSAVPGLYSWT